MSYISVGGATTYPYVNILSSGPSIPPVITDGLMMYLDASVASSLQDPNWLDLSGRNNNGLLINGPTFQPTNGGVITMDGVNDKVHVADTTDFNFNNEFTYQIAFNSTLFSSYRNLMVHRGSRQRIGIWTNGSRLYREVSNNGRVKNSAGNTSLSVSLNTWYIITLVLNTNKVLKIFRNLTSQTLSTNMDGLFTDQTGPLEIGSHGGFPQNFRGDMAFALVYNRGLSQLEIEHNYNLLKTRLGI